MKTSLLALLLFFLLVVILYLVFRPVQGWYWLYRLGTKANQKKISEDILKKSYHAEDKNQKVTQEFLINKLQLPQPIIFSALEAMQQKGLIKLNADRVVTLENEGRNYALQIIRAHRLYEQFLAEKTGFHKLEWDQKADKMEHKLNEEELAKIINQIGNPRFDPHGDPIPTEKGEIQAIDGIKLPKVPNGSVGRIVNIDDKPFVNYKQILAENIHVGSVVRVIENNENRIIFYSEGEDYILVPEIANNITINIFNAGEEEQEEKNAVRLSSLKKGEKGEVISISKDCRGSNRHRLLDLGFVKGSTVEIDLVSPMQNPKAFLVRNTSIALRNSQTKHILIKKINNV